MIFQALDGGISPDEVGKMLLWMPSHGSKTVIGRAIKSDGSAVTALDWRANRLVDALAKAAAGKGRVDKSLLAFWDAAGEAVEFCAATLGMVTYAANNVRESAQRADGTYVYALRRDACPIPFLNAAQRPLRRTARGHDDTTTTALASDASAPQPAPTADAPASARELNGRAAAPASAAAASSRTLPPPAADAHPETESHDDLAAERAALARGAKARAATAAALKEEQAERRFAQAWHLQRAAAAGQSAPQALTAQERLEALRRRVRARAAAD